MNNLKNLMMFIQFGMETLFTTLLNHYRTLLKGTTPLHDFRTKHICAFLPMELQTCARAKTPKPLEIRWIFSLLLQCWKHRISFFLARGIILCSGDGHLLDRAAFWTFWATVGGLGGLGGWGWGCDNVRWNFHTWSILHVFQGTGAHAHTCSLLRHKVVGLRLHTFFLVRVRAWYHH